MIKLQTASIGTAMGLVTRCCYDSENAARSAFELQVKTAEFALRKAVSASKVMRRMGGKSIPSAGPLRIVLKRGDDILLEWEAK